MADTFVGTQTTDRYYKPNYILTKNLDLDSLYAKTLDLYYFLNRMLGQIRDQKSHTSSLSIKILNLAIISVLLPVFFPLKIWHKLYQ